MGSRRVRRAVVRLGLVAAAIVVAGGVLLRASVRNDVPQGPEGPAVRRASTVTGS
jgi:hypothetical protein